jgi:hypothetical protein
MKNSITLSACFLIVCCLILASCSNKEKKALKESWPSGKLKKSGWVNKDNIPVDTMFYYFENGKYQRIEVRDESGSLNGITTSFNEDGTIYQQIPYVNNAIEGFIASYTAGRLTSRIHRVKARQLGDAYWYDAGGKIYQYDFYGFGDGHRNFIKYDQSGNIVNKIAPFIFMDSVSSYTPANSEEKVCEVFLLLSNAPKCRTSVVIEYLSKDSAIIKQDSITGRSYYYKKEQPAQSIYSIVFMGRQYDSLTGKNLSQKMSRRLSDF